MDITIDEQLICGGCGYSRTFIESMKHGDTSCPICASRSMNHRSIDPSRLEPDQIVPIQLNRKSAREAATKVLSRFSRQRHFKIDAVNESVFTAMYVPFWHFDLSIDEDGPGPKKPTYKEIRKCALEPPMALMIEPLITFSGPFIRFDERYIRQVPMVVPQIPYLEASKPILIGVQDNLSSSRRITAERQSGIIGEVGMVTHLQLIPIWLLTMRERDRLHRVVVDAVNGNVYPFNP